MEDDFCSLRPLAGYGCGYGFLHFQHDLKFPLLGADRLIAPKSCARKKSLAFTKSPRMGLTFSFLFRSGGG